MGVPRGPYVQQKKRRVNDVMGSDLSEGGKADLESHAVAVDGFACLLGNYTAAVFIKRGHYVHVLPINGRLQRSWEFWKT